MELNLAPMSHASKDEAFRIGKSKVPWRYVVINPNMQNLTYDLHDARLVLLVE
jgi:hypothetical protein